VPFFPVLFLSPSVFVYLPFRSTISFVLEAVPVNISQHMLQQANKKKTVQMPSRIGILNLDNITLEGKSILSL
jgi:hypothetical protein